MQNRRLTFATPDCPVCLKAVDKFEYHPIKGFQGEEVGCYLVATCHGETCEQKVMLSEYADTYTDHAFTDPRMHTIAGRLTGKAINSFDKENI